MAAAGLSVAPRRRCWQWDLRVGVGAAETTAAQGTGVCKGAGVGPPPWQERQGGGPQTGPLKPRLRWQQTGSKDPDGLAMVSATGRVNRGPLPPATALSSFARRQRLAWPLSNEWSRLSDCMEAFQPQVLHWAHRSPFLYTTLLQKQNGNVPVGPHPGVWEPGCGARLPPCDSSGHRRYAHFFKLIEAR